MEAGRSAPPEALDTTSTPGKSTLGGPLGGLLVSPSKPVAARRGQWRLSRGLHWHAALPQDAACLRTGVVWRRTTSHCSSSDAGPPAPKMDAPARVQRLDEARGSGRCRWRMRTTPASQTGLCSVLMASSVKNSRFSEEHRTTESHDGPGRAPGLARGTATPRRAEYSGLHCTELDPLLGRRQITVKSRPARVAVLMLISVFNALPRRSSVILRSGSPMCRPSFLAVDAFVHDPNSRFPPSAIDPYDGSTGKTDSQQPASRTRSGSGFVSRCLYQRPVCLLRLRQPCVCSPAEPVINLSCAVLLVAITQIAGGSRAVWGQPPIPRGAGAGESASMWAGMGGGGC